MKAMGPLYTACRHRFLFESDKECTQLCCQGNGNDTRVCIGPADAGS